MSVHCVLEYLLLDYMGWWAPVCCGMSVHCVLEYLLLDYMGWWSTGLLWDVSTLCAGVPPAGLYGLVGTGLLWDVSTLRTAWYAPGRRLDSEAPRAGLAVRVATIVVASV
jgi:hypothetical protein